MKKIATLALFLSLSAACVQSIFPANPVTPRNISTPDPITPATATQFADQSLIEGAQMNYYDITGSTADELRHSMDQLRPTDPYDANKPVDSYADWYIAWNWPGYGTDNCDLSASTITYTINVIMPRWRAPADASPDLTAKWEKYIQSLTFHEKGHVDNIINNYLTVMIAIQDASCLTAEAEAQKALDDLRQFDSNYDSETKHGETQGAVFP